MKQKLTHPKGSENSQITKINIPIERENWEVSNFDYVRYFKTKFVITTTITTSSNKKRLLRVAEERVTTLWDISSQAAQAHATGKRDGTWPFNKSGIGLHGGRFKNLSAL